MAGRRRMEATSAAADNAHAIIRPIASLRFHPSATTLTALPLRQCLLVVWTDASSRRILPENTMAR